MSASADSHRLTLVAAPAGYGKSTFLGDWVRNCDLPCAWLSLDRFDTEPARLFHGVVGAIQRAAGTMPMPGNDALMALDQSLAHDGAASYDLLLRALEELTEPIVLVIDDVHLAGPGLATGIVGVLAASAPPSLRLVLSGRGHTSIQLERFRYGEGLGELRAPELAFTQEEVAQFAFLLGQDAAFDAGSLWRMTAGWPVAVHAGIVSLAQARNAPITTPVTAPGTTATHVPLADYVAEEILDQLEPSLAEFILRATTCDWLGRRLAVELYGRPHGGVLLEECLRNGLFIEEHDYRGGESMYRWHSLFAAQCRRILERRDPLLAERLHRVAARYYQDSDVVECTAQALQGRAPRQAVMSLGAHWLDFVLGNDTQSLERLCRDLPAPWSEDPEVLMIRSVCRMLSGDSAAAAELTERALSRTYVLDALRRRRLEACRAHFEPTPSVGRQDVHATPADGGRPIRDISEDSHSAACSTGLFLLAEAEFRLHRTGDLAEALLQAAGGTGNPVRLEAIEICAQADLALAFAGAGDLVRASEDATSALDRADALGWSSQERMAPAWLARGIACYWNDNLAAAQKYLARAQRLGSELFPAGPLSVIYRVLTDCAIDDPGRLAESSSALASFHTRGLYNVSWNALHTIAVAKVAEAQGDLEGALAIVQPLGAGGHGALVDSLLAELLRRGGEIDAAQRCAESLTGRRGNSYVDTCASLTEALVAHGTGDTATAHERIEHAVHRAEPESVFRPFAERREELADLLVQHAVWGTAHESFIAALMARDTQGGAQLRTQSYWSLTEREREVLAYMRSIMTAAEIADALYISVNTVKTHERSIYRKLGAGSRRDALKTAAKRGIV
ncbi:LuxR C-terminal-related transcriptional regulator [Arthrobacter sp. NPDC058130]|uniref:LuxR C-terminal-related transcriptional regulator n=1 Tax=Arthrobacter sp. NPDC058130 TaxID=3346353 RepID=UPI0036E7658C